MGAGVNLSSLFLIMRKLLYLKLDEITPIEIRDPQYIVGEFYEKAIFNAIEKSNYTIEDNDKLFFMPGTTIPRIKLKDLYAKTKSKTVRNVSEATKVIVGKKTLDTLTDRRWYNWCNTDAFKAVLTQEFAAGNLDEYYYDKYMEVLNSYTEEYIIGDYDLQRFGRHYVIDDNLRSSSSDSFTILNTDYEDLFNNTIGNQIEVYSEDTLISLVNGEDSAIIDLAMYESLRQMFDSSDNDNTVLAMEIMANSNYEESLYYLCLLFHDYSHLISDTRSRTHVNFKSLSSYIGFSSPSYCSMDKDKIIDVLIDKKVFNVTHAKDLLVLFNDEVNEYGSTNHFKVSRITLSEKALTYLKNESSTNPE